MNKITITLVSALAISCSSPSNTNESTTSSNSSIQQKVDIYKTYLAVDSTVDYTEVAVDPKERVATAYVNWLDQGLLDSDKFSNEDHKKALLNWAFCLGPYPLTASNPDPEKIGEEFFNVLYASNELQDLLSKCIVTAEVDQTKSGEVDNSGLGLANTDKSPDLKDKIRTVSTATPSEQSRNYPENHVALSGQIDEKIEEAITPKSEGTPESTKDNDQEVNDSFFGE